MRFSGHTFPERFDVDDDAEHDKFATTWPCLRRDIITCIKLAPRKKRMATRGFRDQNAGPDPGWLVAAGGLKKKNGRHNFFAF